MLRGSGRVLPAHHLTVSMRFIHPSGLRMADAWPHSALQTASADSIVSRARSNSPTPLCARRAASDHYEMNETNKGARIGKNFGPMRLARGFAPTHRRPTTVRGWRAVLSVRDHSMVRGATSVSTSAVAERWRSSRSSCWLTFRSLAESSSWRLLTLWSVLESASSTKKAAMFAGIRPTTATPEKRQTRRPSFPGSSPALRRREAVG